ncbi:MAG: molecular chaperone TorD family protein, partial [Coriobacteriaceae bacterium]|nr:molecular chaperone TorD family protein [Coriobacteriaceae bacterium]
MADSHEAYRQYAASDMYQALSHFMFRTSPELAQALHRGDYHRDMCDIMAELGFGADEAGELTRSLAADAFSPTSADDLFHALRKDYTHLFSNPKISVMTPYESRFLGHEEGKSGQAVPLGTVVVEVARAYEEAGFTVEGTPPERGDHMGVELSFMQVLRKNLGCMIDEGDDERGREVEGAIQGFLDRHLGGWGVAFFNAIAEKAEGDVYRAIGAIG